MRLAIVTPSFNQAAYLEQAIRSVLDQGCDALDYVVMDGGSTDGSADIIQRHADRLHHWQSGPDGGQYAAVAAGFARTEGEIMGWINADDAYMPWSFSTVLEIFRTFPEVRWLTAQYQLLMDDSGRPLACARSWGYSRAAFYGGDNLPGCGFMSGWIQQEATFWRRSLWEEAGGFDPDFPLAGDFALWSRFFRHADLWSVATPLAAFRRHPGQRSAVGRDRYAEEAKAALLKAGGRPWGRVRSGIEVALKRFTPRGLRRPFQALGLGGPCGLIHRDFDAGTWRAEWI